MSVDAVCEMVLQVGILRAVVSLADNVVDWSTIDSFEAEAMEVLISMAFRVLRCQRSHATDSTCTSTKPFMRLRDGCNTLHLRRFEDFCLSRGVDPLVDGVRGIPLLIMTPVEKLA